MRRMFCWWRIPRRGSGRAWRRSSIGPSGRGIPGTSWGRLFARDVAEDAFEGAARGGVSLLRDSPGLVGETAAFEGELHRLGHFHGVFGVGDPRVQQDAVGAEF